MHTYLLKDLRYLKSVNAPACLLLTLGAEQVFSRQLWASGDDFSQSLLRRPFLQHFNNDHKIDIP